MPLSAGDKLGPYEILAPIGAGGMGDVYKARDSRLDRTVAIKVAKAEFSERFEREARAVAALNHPRICQLYDVGPNYLVFEYVEGQVPKGPLPLETALAYASQICEALDAAHARKIIHRDLKPANTLVTRQGMKLLDFGLAKFDKPVAVSEETLTMALTSQGQILGTLQYMSPEQLQAKEADARSDIFALGCLLYEMLTGKRAFEGASQASVIAAILERPAPSLAGIAPPALERVLTRCLEKDPDKRWQSASDLRWALENLQSSEGIAQTQPQPFRAGGWVAWAAAGVLAALLGAAVWMLWPKPATPAQPVRFSLNPPAQSQFAFPFFGQSVSPDGRFIVFSAGSASTQASLWLRPVDSVDARALPGTEGGNGPFWSPDSKSIAFLADNKLKRVDIEGGSPQSLCAADFDFEGGAWGRNGVILFSDGKVIRSVPATGGTSAPVTSLDPARVEIGHYFPQFLPDGRTILYVIRSPKPDVRGLYTATLDAASGKATRGARLIPEGSSKALYTPPFAGSPGYLLWMRAEDLVAQRFDPAHLRLEGNATVVAESVDEARLTGFRRAAFWTSDTGLLAYFGGQFGGSQGFQLDWLSRDGKQREPIGPRDSYDWPRLSPDGTRFAVSRGAASEQNDIWVYEFSRKLMTRLTFQGINNQPVWSPDGAKIAFSSAYSGAPKILRKAASGTGETETLLEGDGALMDWSRDGKYLVYEQQNANTGWDLMVAQLDGAGKPAPFLQTPFDERHAAFSPDGKWIAYDSDESGKAEVYIQSFPASGGKWQVSNAGGTIPRWRGDGKELYFRLASLGDLMAASIHVSSGRIDVEAPHQLFRWTGPPTYDASADGQHFLMQDPPGVNDFSIVKPMTVVTNWQAALKK
jgi:Tol biopolymer transport system component